MRSLAAIKGPVRGLGVMGLLLAAAVAVNPATAAEVRFVVLGDLPYPDGNVGENSQQSVVNNKIRDAIGTRDPAPSFVIHYGDFKGGSEPCSDKLFRERRSEIKALLAGRVFYTPGDNDWTDCDRGPAVDGKRWELDWLDFVRKEFFTGSDAIRVTLPHERQESYPENARWTLDDVVFATLHLVGTDNGRNKIKIDGQDAPEALETKALDRVDARDAANLAWLYAAFVEAVTTKAKAVVVTVHADVTDVKKKRRGKRCTPSRRKKCDAYVHFLDHLRELAKDFGKPVLLVHGSTDDYCLDRGFGNHIAPRLWGLNGPGDYWIDRDEGTSGGVLDAAEVVFDPNNEDRPFTVETLLEGRKPRNGC